jgi:hypothetical protein
MPQKLKFARHTKFWISNRFLPILAESFPIQYQSLEELTVTTLTVTNLPENDNITAFHKFVKSCRG